MPDNDVLLEKVWAGLRDAEPSPGFERRIFARMSAHQPRRAVWLRPVLALACALFAASFVHGFRPVSVPVMKVAIEAPGPESLPPLRIAEGTSRRRRSQPHLSALPLPLTEQERLLVRLAHRADDAAILNPVTREAQSARATTEFQHFFQMNEAEMRGQLE